MDKRTALSHFDGSVTRAAAALGITHSAISQWPNDGPIPDSARNRVEAWLWRRNPKQEAPMWWQPIETAPKDGTIVLVNDTTESCTPWVAASYLNGDEWDGWVYDDAISQDANPLGPQPTHWIQLPEIPQSGEQN